MSLTIDANAAARFNAQVRGAVALVEMDFSTGTLRFNNSSVNLTINGNVYLGFYNLTSISNITESESNSAEKVTIGLSIVNQSMLAATLGNVENYRGRSVRVYLQLMTETFQPDGAPIQRWAGYMDKVTISRTKSPADGGTSTGKIEMQCSRAGMARARAYQGFRLSNTQQQTVYPLDKGLEYLQTLVEQPSIWLSKAFQTI